MKPKRKFYRMWKVISFALSVVIQVYWFRFRNKTDEEQNQLWERIGKKFRRTLFELEGLLIKVGQILSIRADLLPSGFIKEIQDLVDQVPPSPWEEIKIVLENEWNGPILDSVLSIDSKAVASASIGEVYRGKLMDGTEVAIKVQRPTIPLIVNTDFRSLSIIIWFVHHFAPVPKGFINFRMLFQELKQVIQRELDFKKELETAVYFQQRFQNVTGLKIPKVYPELSTSKVLVMEWVEAVRVTDVEFLEQNHIKRDQLADRLFRIFLPQWLEAGMFHADPHAGNVLVTSDGTLVLLDFGMSGEISKNDSANFQNLLEAFLLKNYSKVAEVLFELGFLLPETNSKMFEGLLKKTMSFNLADFKKMGLFAAKKEINDLLNSLPIQVPTRFIFLGRSFATIEGMLQTICPGKETIELMEPAFMDWLNQSPTSKWKIILKWVSALPMFRIAHSISDVLHFPQQYLELKETQQQRELNVSIFENQKKQTFYLGILGLIGAFSGEYLHDEIIWKSSLCLIGIVAIAYAFSSWRQRKWLKKHRYRGKHRDS